MIPKEKLIPMLTYLLKQKGFKKKRTTWFLEIENIVVVFNVQNSQFDREMYYINMGSFINEIESRKCSGISDCHIWQRFDIELDDCEQLLKIIEIWIQWYGSYESITSNILCNHMPKATQKKVYSFFSKPRNQ